MKYRKNLISFKLIISLFSLFLLGAGFSRYIETDSGNILIHDIDLENLEGFIYKGRLFRPLQASSLNNRPAILLIPGDIGDRYSGDHIAMEFARRGFVVLTIEDFSQGMTGPKPETETENSIDAGYTFLSTRTFIDPDRIGLLTYYEGAEKAAASKYISDFAAAVFISPKSIVISTDDAADDRVFTAAYETDPAFRIDPASDQIQSVSVFHADMLVSGTVLANILEYFHKVLAIPNDSPFWFDASSQKAPLLLFLRGFLLFLLLIICNAQCVLISKHSGSRFLLMLLSLLLPLGFFTITEEFMNCFLISVRLGSPFNYLSGIRQLFGKFSFVICLAVVLFTFLTCFPINKNGKIYISDLLFIIGAVICLFGIIPILFGNRSGWEISGTFHYRRLVFVLSIISALSSFLNRFAGNSNFSRICSSVLNGLLFYWIISNIPLSFLWEGSV